MRITKYGHACLFIDNGKEVLVIDPGSFTELPGDSKNIRTLVISEEHQDHFHMDNVKKILRQSPKAQIFTTSSVGEQLKTEKIAHEVVQDKKTVDKDGFNITLVEGDHAITYGKSPCRVLTVGVGNFLYYPSDSFIPTSDSYRVLALPTGGPWHKLAESVDFAKAVDSEAILATHNGLFNEIGNDVACMFTKINLPDKEWVYLKVGESKEFN